MFVQIHVMEEGNTESGLAAKGLYALGLLPMHKIVTHKTAVSIRQKHISLPE